MMYTPTPATRRPRPPGSLNRSKTRTTILPKNVNTESDESSTLPAQDKDSEYESAKEEHSTSDTPLSVYIRERQQGARNALRRITASPADLSDVSVGLDNVANGASPSGSRGRSRVSRIGLGLPVALNLPGSGSTPTIGIEDEMQPSPPPPYGSALPSDLAHHIGSTSTHSTHTPPSQDICVQSRQTSGSSQIEIPDENLHEARVNPTYDRGQEVGQPLAADVGSNSGSSSEGGPSESRTRYMDSLTERPPWGDDEMLTRLAERLAQPHSRSSPYTSRPKMHDDRPSFTRQASSPRYARLEALRAEDEDRIAALEEALHEAREGEENNRKIVARLRREIEKLQRDLLRAEERMTEAIFSSPVHPRFARGRRPPVSVAEGLPRRTRPLESSASDEALSGRLGWGSTAFPEFPQDQEQLPRANISKLPRDNQSVLSQSSEDDITDSVSKPVYKNRKISFSEQDPPRAPGSIKHRAGASTRGLQLTSITPAKSGYAGIKEVGTRASANDQFTKSPYPLTPQVKVHSPAGSTIHASASVSGKRFHRTSSIKSQRSGDGSGNKSMRRSPWPLVRKDGTVNESTPDPRRTIDFTTSSTRDLSGTPSPSSNLNSAKRSSGSRSSSISPFASLTRKMAGMHAYVSQSLSLNFPPSTQKENGRGRTLGSELGSEFGDHRDTSVMDVQEDTIAPPSPSPSPIKSKSKSKSRSSLSLIAVSAPDSSSTSAVPHTTSESDSCNDTNISRHNLRAPIAKSGDADEEDSDPPGTHPPFPLPPQVSAALSSLAMALAPASLFSSQSDLSRTILYSAGDYAQSNDRRIRWAAMEGDSRKKKLNTQYQGKRAGFGSPYIQSVDDSWETDETNPTDGDQGEYKDDERREPLIEGNSRLLHVKLTTGIRAKSPTPTRRISLAHRRVNSINAASAAETEARRLQITSSDHKEDGFVLRRLTSVSPSPSRVVSRSGINRGKGTEVTSRSRSVSPEPSTIPARVVHDLICLLAIYAEYIEWILILFIKIVMDVRSGPRGVPGLRDRTRPKRYYI